MKLPLRGAFSLVELLVVLAIMLLLAALLLPVFSRVRQNGERTTCASNLRGLGQAMQIYLQDNNGAFPIAATTTVTNGVASSVTWSDRVEKSVPIQGIIHCPAVPSGNRWAINSPDYNLGRDVSADAQIKRKGKPLLLRFQSQFAETATTELFIEALCGDGCPLKTGRYIQTKTCGRQSIFNLHLDGANIAYLDGHVKWMSANAQSQHDEVCGW